ncbi:DUF92 domain-containing protein [Bacillus solitudinis]|uniref:DUF92 domain-containing protein n=1 Tax=Bacillus solitudinis TaxID=2014074 RepID=UPI000C238C0C|nr:DUF92 domain-containing protein [Bacillus solitudinis]
MILILSLIVVILSMIAYILKKLTKSGAVTAVLVGMSIVFGLGLPGLLLLGVFFVSSNLLGYFQKERKENDIIEKGNQRDGWQVLANGGMAAILALIYGFFPSSILICAFVTSLAAANADTWASEIGILSKQRPLHIITWKRVNSGTSGAVTAVGSAGAFAGSFLIVVCSIFFWWSSSYNSHIFLLAFTIAGFLGNLIDTLAGAALQVLYRCKVCKIETEQTLHCHEATEHISGLKWVNNDTVNFICTVSGGLFGLVLGLILL